jgi:hypothetical protein
MRSLSVLAVTLTIVAAPGAANFQTSDQPIVVKATPLDPERARQRATDFVKSTGVANGQKQVARWVVPVCIKVIGVSAAPAARIEDQMLRVAREANVPVARRGCEPNLSVTFAADAGEVVRQIYARRPRRLIETSTAEREQLLYGSAPVRWWYATEMTDRDGVKGHNMTATFITSGDKYNGVFSLPDGMPTTQQYNSGSHVRTPTVRSLYGATVIVDATKAARTPIDSIAAYAAMVAFAEMDAEAPPPDSILGLFQPSSIENSLTDWDMAFLKSLYRMPLDRRSRIQRGHLVEALLDERLPKESKSK